MPWFIIIILAAALGVSITLLFLTRNEIKNMTSNLKEINSAETNKKLMPSSPGRCLENLAREINKSIDKRHETEVKYRRMDAELRQAITNISHDLRTPLTSIIGYIQLIKDISLSYEERSRYADIILKKAKSLNMLLSGFFDLSRLEAGEYGLRLQKVNLSKTLCEIMASFYNDFTSKGIEPKVGIDDTICEIIADEPEVCRIFTNIIQNALKFGNKFIEVSLGHDENFILASFTNDAPDLTDDDARHLFERFFTADRIRNGLNTGLGLAITKDLVQNMGGTISSNLYMHRLSIIIKWPYKAEDKL